MRKELVECIITVVVIVVFTLVAGYAVGDTIYDSRTYPATMIVQSIENDVVTIEDSEGFLWQFIGAEDWNVGDICSVMMYDNGTPEILDDEIVKNYNSGFNIKDFTNDSNCDTIDTEREVRENE